MLNNASNNNAYSIVKNKHNLLLIQLASSKFMFQIHLTFKQKKGKRIVYLFFKNRNII